MSIDETEHELTHFDLVIYPEYSESIREICEKIMNIQQRKDEYSRQLKELNQKEISLNHDMESFRQFGMTSLSVMSMMQEHAFQNQIQECQRNRVILQQIFNDILHEHNKYRSYLRLILNCIDEDYGRVFKNHVEKKIQTSYPTVKFKF